MKVTIDRNKCVGAGQCVLAAPEVFAQSDEDGLVVLRVQTPSTELREPVRAAANLCPSLAITVEDD